MRVAIALRGARAGASVGPTPVAVMVCIVLAGVASVACSSGEQVSDVERTETLLGTTATTSATDTTEMSVTTTASPTTVEDTSPSATDANVNESTGRPMTVEWTDDARRVGSVEVPLDHDDPSEDRAERERGVSPEARQRRREHGRERCKQRGAISKIIHRAGLY